ncbi:proteoglycan 3 [Bombina bombina]|uniref:proteoglycan 3 n=1 Tax=Bombina bombina TaxID=8345 RepID=UPI00235B264E|nr:proteoglycan 3 [Bombina bombina]
MSHLFFLLLVIGAISAQESGDFSSGESPDDFISDEEPTICDNEHETPEELDVESSNDCHMENYQNVTVEFDKEVADLKVCPGKADCSYHYFIHPRSFCLAQRACRCRRGKMSSIHNAHTNLLLARSASRVNRHTTFAWIGAVKRLRSCSYSFVDGSRFDYTNWAPGYPKTCGAWCVAINIRTGKWVSLRCYTRLPFFCTL